MVNQILIATGMIGVCEALLYGYKAGLDLERVLESVASGAAGSWSLTNYGPRMLSGDFAPGFIVDHFVKDMGIALAEAEADGALAAGASARQATLCRPPGARRREARDAFARARNRVAVGRRLGESRLELDQQRQIDSPGIRRSRRRPQRLHILGMTPAVARSARRRTTQTMAHGTRKAPDAVMSDISAPRGHRL